jgi:hypothetical protein
LKSQRDLFNAELITNLQDQIQTDVEGKHAGSAWKKIQLRIPCAAKLEYSKLENGFERRSHFPNERRDMSVPGAARSIILGQGENPPRI